MLLFMSSFEMYWATEFNELCENFGVCYRFCMTLRACELRHPFVPTDHLHPLLQILSLSPFVALISSTSLAAAKWPSQMTLLQRPLQRPRTRWGTSPPTNTPIRTNSTTQNDSSDLLRPTPNTKNVLPTIFPIQKIPCMVIIPRSKSTILCTTRILIRSRGTAGYRSAIRELYK